MTSKARRGSEESTSLATSPEVVICIPAYNESVAIGNIVQRSKVFSPLVLVCDDGSTDATSTEAANSGAIVFKHPTNRGKGAALRTLLQEAAKLRPKAVVTIDGDGQHNPGDIAVLIAPLLDNTADVVIGSRFGKENDVPFYRRFGNSFLTLLTNHLARTNLQDTQSGFRAYASRVLPNISIRDNGMGVDSQVLIQIARKGFRIQERAVSVTYSGDTSTFNPLSHMLRVLWSISHGSRSGSKKAVPTLWTASFVAVIMTALVSGFLLPPSRIVIATSSLALGAIMTSLILSQKYRLNRWIRRAR